MKYQILTKAAGFACILGLLSGCVAEEDGTTQEERTQAKTGMALTADVAGDTDVSYVKFTIDRVACNDNEEFEPLHREFVKELEDARLPGMIPEFENHNLDEDSAHLFADQFVVVPAGCYSVATQPLTEAEEASDDCESASVTDAVVFDGETTELFLINQCDGGETGGLDTASALNHEPTLISLDFQPSKFVYECETTTLCATAHDPDGDPVEFNWSQESGPDLYEGFEVVSEERNGNEITQCVSFTPRWTEDYGLNVTVFDLLHHGNELVRIEDWLEDQGYPAESRDSLNFPLYVNWDIEMQCYDAENDTLHYLPEAREVERADGCDWTTPAQYYCNDHYVDTSVYCPNGEFAPEEAYPACE